RAQLNKSKEAIDVGKSDGIFTINSEGGCRACKGDGIKSYYIGFGNFVEVECEICGGTGFIEEALSVTLDGKNIKDIMNMSVAEAAEFFGLEQSEAYNKSVSAILTTLQRVGLGYITLGQKTPTISGGEAQ